MLGFVSGGEGEREEAPELPPGADPDGYTKFTSAIDQTAGRKWHSAMAPEEEWAGFSVHHPAPAAAAGEYASGDDVGDLDSLVATAIGQAEGLRYDDLLEAAGERRDVPPIGDQAWSPPSLPSRPRSGHCEACGSRVRPRSHSGSPSRSRSRSKSRRRRRHMNDSPPPSPSRAVTQRLRDESIQADLAVRLSTGRRSDGNSTYRSVSTRPSTAIGLRSPSAAYHRAGAGTTSHGYCHGPLPPSDETARKAAAEGVDSDDEAFAKSLYQRYSSVKVAGEAPRALGESRVKKPPEGLPREFGVQPNRNMMLSLSPSGRPGGAVPRLVSRADLAAKFVKNAAESVWEWNGEENVVAAATAANARPVSAKGPYVAGSSEDMAQWIRVLHRRLDDRNRQLLYVRDVYARDVVKVKEAVFQKDKLPDSKLSDLNTSALAHEFLRMFFGKTNMAILEQEELDMLRSLTPGFKRLEGQLEMTVKEAARLSKRHTQLSESAQEVATRCDEAERKLTVERDNCGSLRDLLQESEQARERMRQDLDSALHKISELTSHHADLPVMLSRASRHAGMLATALTAPKEDATHLQDQLKRFQDVLDALEGFDEMDLPILKARALAAENELARMREDVAAKDARLRTLSTKYEALKDDLEFTKAPRVSVGTDTSDLFNDLRDLKDRLREATAKNATIVTEVAALRLKAWEQEEQLKAVMLELEETKETVATLEQEGKGYRKRIEAMTIAGQEQRDAHRAKLEVVSRSREAAQMALEELEQHHTTLTDRCEDYKMKRYSAELELMSTRQSMQVSIDDLLRQLDGANGAIKALEEDKEKLGMDIQRAETNGGNLQDKLEAEMYRCKEMHKSLVEARTTISRHEKALGKLEDALKFYLLNTESTAAGLDSVNDELVACYGDVNTLAHRGPAEFLASKAPKAVEEAPPEEDTVPAPTKDDAASRRQARLLQEQKEKAENEKLRVMEVVRVHFAAHHEAKAHLAGSANKTRLTVTGLTRAMMDVGRAYNRKVEAFDRAMSAAKVAEAGEHAKARMVANLTAKLADRDERLSQLQRLLDSTNDALQAAKKEVDRLWELSEEKRAALSPEPKMVMVPAPDPNPQLVEDLAEARAELARAVEQHTELVARLKVEHQAALLEESQRHAAEESRSMDSIRYLQTQLTASEDENDKLHAHVSAAVAKANQAVEELKEQIKAAEKETKPASVQCDLGGLPPPRTGRRRSSGGLALSNSMGASQRKRPFTTNTSAVDMGGGTIDVPNRMFTVGSDDMDSAAAMNRRHSTSALPRRAAVDAMDSNASQAVAYSGTLSSLDMSPVPVTHRRAQSAGVSRSPLSHGAVCSTEASADDPPTRRRSVTITTPVAASYAQAYTEDVMAGWRASSPPRTPDAPQVLVVDPVTHSSRPSSALRMTLPGSSMGPPAPQPQRAGSRPRTSHGGPVASSSGPKRSSVSASGTRRVRLPSMDRENQPHKQKDGRSTSVAALAARQQSMVTTQMRNPRRQAASRRGTTPGVHRYDDSFAAPPSRGTSRAQRL